MFLSYWYGVDPLKESTNIYLIEITKLLNQNIIWLIVIGIIGILLKLILDEINFRELKRLRNENDKLNRDLIECSETLKDLSKDILKDFSKEKLLSDIDPQMRLSLYLKDKESNLYCLGRYSKNSEFSEFSSNRIYQEGGIIIESWRDGNNDGKGKFDNNFPDPIKTPKKYKTYQEKHYGLSSSVVSDMKMKSRLYYSYRVEYNGENLGVILIESLCNNKYNKDNLHGLIHDLESRIIIVLNSTFKYLDAPQIYPNNNI